MKKYIPISILLVLLCIVELGQYLWVDNSTFAMRYDSARHAYACSHLDDNPMMPLFPYPKLLHILGSLSLQIFGHNRWAFFILQSTIAICLILLIYGCGRILIGPWGGLLAGSIALANPTLLLYWRSFFTDILLALGCMWQLYTYLQSERLQKPLWTILFALSMPLAAFSRYQYLTIAIFFYPAIAIDLAWDIYDKTDDKLYCVKNLIKYFIILAICSCLGAICGYALSNDPIWWLIGAMFGTISANIGCKRSHMYKRLERFFTITGLLVIVTSILHIIMREATTEDYFLHVNHLFGAPKESFTLSEWSDIQLKRVVAFIVDLKGYVLTPITYWPFIVSLIYAITSKQRLKKIFIPLLCTVCYCPLMALCSGCDRFYIPALGWIVLIIASFFISHPKIAKFYSVIYVIYSLSISIGWLFPNLPIDVHPYTLSDIDTITFDRYNQRFDPSCEKVFLKGNKMFWRLRDKLTRVTLRDDDKLSSLFNFKTIWSDNLFFSLSPYEVHWDKIFSDIAKILPSNAIISTEYVEDIKWNDEIITQNELSAFALFSLDFCAPEKNFLPEYPLQAHEGKAYLIYFTPPDTTPLPPSLVDERGRQLKCSLLYSQADESVLVSLWYYHL